MRLLPADDPALPLNEQVICAGVERADRVAVRAVGSVIAVEPQPGAAQVNPFAELDEHLAPTRSVLLRLPPVALRVGEKHVKPVSERPVCRQTEVDLDTGGEARTLHTFAGRGASASLALGGKAYQVNVMVGGSTSAQHIAEALAVGRSFRLAP